jgi:hypothetical protein
LKLTENQNISFTATGKAVVDAFSKVKSVVSYVKADDGKFVLATVKDAVYAVGVSTDAVACIKVKDAVPEELGVIGIDADLLSGVLKNRGPMTFAVSGKLKISEVKGRYTSQIEVNDFDHNDVAMLQQYLTPTKTAALSPAQIAVIRTGVKQVELQDFYGDSVLLALIDVKEQGIVVTCFDNYHAAQFTQRIESSTKMRMALPTKAFAMIDKFVAGSKAKFENSSGRLRVAGPDFLICIPETQVEDDMYNLFSLYKKSLKNPVTSFIFDTKAVASVENMFALVDKDTKMAMNIFTKEVQIEVSTARGSVSDSFKTAVEGRQIAVHVDPRIFMDLFKKVKDRKDIPLSLYHVRGASSSLAFKVKSNDATLTLVGSFESEESNGKD